MKSIVISGGGTGGHFFPALEMAKTLIENGFDVSFIGVKRGIEARILPKEKIALHVISFEGIRERGIKGLKAVFKLPLSVFSAFKFLKKKRPVAVICTGGYSSFPTGFSAWIMGVPLFIHEQNTVPGWANAVLSIFAKKIFVSFEESKNYFLRKPVVFTGNFVRREMTLRRFSLPKGSFTLFVVGGSSGARTINKAVVEALPKLSRLPVKVIHQTGRLDGGWVREAYEKSGFKKAKVSEFIEDMKNTYINAHLVISRAGATTLFELSSVGRAAVLVPYPYAVSDHQKLNASILCKRKAAICIDNKNFTSENFLMILSKLFFNRKLLIKMHENMWHSLRNFSQSELLRRLEV